MRDSNYRSIVANRAAVTISTTLYDRRALDCTSDKPLVNSLNHLTFLASSSGKVRETLSNDGGLERLVDILYECKLDEKNQSMDENPLVAWKWSLAFQCLVLVGTRGTEAIRKKVVDAGMIPVIATVLDNYLTMSSGHQSSEPNFHRQNAAAATAAFERLQERIHNSFQAVPDNRDDEDSDINETLDTDVPNQGSTASRASTTGTFTSVANTSTTADDFMKGLSQGRRRNRPHAWPNHIEQLKEKIDLMQDIIHLTSSTEFDADEDDLSASKLLIDYVEEKNFILDATKGKHAKHKKNRRRLVDVAAPRSFINGILVPREDDVLWSLQLLAFISKYSYLKPILSETSIITGLSLRSPVHEDLLSFNGNFSNSVPALENDDNDNDNELEEVRSVDNDKKDDHDEIMIDTEGSSNNTNQDVSETDSNSEQLLANKFDLMLPLSMKFALHENKSPSASVVCAESSNFDKLKLAVDKLEYNEDRLSKAKNFIKLSKILNKDLKHENLRVKELKKSYNQLESNYLKSKWNYSSYPFFDNLNEDQDLSIKPLQVLNMFPLVEKFTVKASHSKEIHYWAGVIMRNSCRRDESKGGVRQCACFDCGTWEEYPRQFAKCRRCKRTKYCSKECQATLWEYHRHWCVQTSSSSSNAPSVPSTSAATMSNAGGILNDTAMRQFALRPSQQQLQQQQDNESVDSSLNTASIASLTRQRIQQMATPIGSFVSPELLSMSNNPPLTRATTPQTTNNITPLLAPTNNRGINFGTILFHNAVHATLTATNNTNIMNNYINNNNNNSASGNNNGEDATIGASFRGFGNGNSIGNGDSSNLFNNNNNNNNSNDSNRSDSDS